MRSGDQELIAKIMDLFAEKFGKRAILRGGMVLRILGSQRYTNDLDYVFVPYRSKNQIVEEIVGCLKSIQGTEVKFSLNSQCLRVLVSSSPSVVAKSIVQIEAKVAQNMKSDIASNKVFSAQFNLPPRLIHIVDHSVSMANKLAAWNERRLVRDIYDIWFFLRMNVKPDLDVLEKRLKKPLYAKNMKKNEYFNGLSCADFFEFIRSYVNETTQAEVTEQLADYLDMEDLRGLVLQFRSAFVRLGIDS